MSLSVITYILLSRILFVNYLFLFLVGQKIFKSVVIFYLEIAVIAWSRFYRCLNNNYKFSTLPENQKKIFYFLGRRVEVIRCTLLRLQLI